MTTDMRTIYYRYEIEEPAPGKWVTVWYDEQNEFVYRSAPYPIKSVGENAAKFLFDKYSPLSGKAVETENKPLTITERHYRYTLVEKSNGWYIRWYDKNDKFVRDGITAHPSHTAAIDAAERQYIGFRNKEQGKPLTSAPSKIERPYREYNTYSVHHKDNLWFVRLIDSNGKETLTVGYSNYNEANEFARSKVKYTSEGSYPPRASTPYTPPVVKTWNEKWLEGISRWFPEGVPEDLVQLLK